MINHYLLLAVICFVAMLSPGPDFVLVAKNSLSYRRPQALATAFGIVCGCIVHATYCVLGLALVITQSVILYSTIKYAGACYLIYLGLRGLFSKAVVQDKIDQSARQSISIQNAFIQGLLCNLLNPKLAVFLLSLFTQFIPLGASVADKAGVGLVFLIESAIYWPTLVLILQRDVAINFFNNFKTTLDRIFGGALLLLGVKVALAKD